jgi:PAS domain S-box-containing protein
MGDMDTHTELSTLSPTPEVISTCDPFQDAAIRMAFVTLDGRLLRVNPALSNLLGRNGDTLLASTWSELTHPDDLQASGDQIPALLSGQRPRIDFRVGAVDGQIRVLLVRTYRSEIQPANRAIAMDEEVLGRRRAAGPTNGEVEQCHP